MLGSVGHEANVATKFKEVRIKFKEVNLAIVNEYLEFALASFDVHHADFLYGPNDHSRRAATIWCNAGSCCMPRLIQARQTPRPVLNREDGIRKGDPQGDLA